MQFVIAPTDIAAQAITASLCDALAAGKRTLWLVSGGSNIAAEVAVLQKLQTHAAPALPRLTILPMDERYGAPGHEDSNTEQLRQAGFTPGAADWVDVLARDLPLTETVAYYTEQVSAALGSAEAVIAQFGLGPDGHVAGILPGSPACMDDAATVAGYEWRDYTRLTLTPRALARADVAYALAYGEQKQTALKRLQANTEPFTDLPARVLYDVPEVYVYNDFIESEG
jgi:6-phosphogluconolactonase/glucosamine-6-phosphate isomerase/deaminase